MLTDVDGVRRDAADPATRVARLDARTSSRRWSSAGRRPAGMAPKATACVAAVRAGVGAAHLLDGRIAHAVLLELFTDRGIGTMVTP